MPESDTLTCADLRRVDPALPCCGSCHDEWDEGYGDPCERVVGTCTLLVCCKMSEAVGAQPDEAGLCVQALAARPAEAS